VKKYVEAASEIKADMLSLPPMTAPARGAAIILPAARVGKLRYAHGRDARLARVCWPPSPPD